ncbi:ShlB/FhaC/HecB family hemolysin secretion/activation protein [Neoroseomonas rubea]|uniref:ShlB/FhaC/HecB family hemolysin secretion/activation protein n=1 Tax=Neoroseomonas rubea TaxID=2748666 RepID=UPI0018DF746F|nr:ShlB/FhaC/HecB family hemolysin secretion/activation protein [Roseomonas rubea]
MRLIATLGSMGIMLGLTTWALPADAQVRQAGRVAPAQQVQVNSLELHGNTLYDTATLLAFAGGLVQQQQGQVTLPALAAAIERLYREDDYFLASATPVFDPATGHSHIEIDEGGLRRIEVLGVEERIGQRIADYFRPILTGAPLRMADFERSLMLAGDLSGVQLRAEFRIDPANNQNVLVVHATARRWRVSAMVDNTPRQQSGNAYLSAELYSGLMAGDMARVIVGGSGETDWSGAGFNFAGFYRFPVGDAGTYVEVFGANTVYGRDVEGNLTDRRQSRGISAVALVGHPVVRDIHQFLYVFAEYAYGEIDYGDSAVGRDRSSAGRLMAYYTNVEDSFATVRAGVSATLGSADSTRSPFVDSTFWHVRAVGGVVVPLRRIDDGLALRIEGYAQATSSSLPETERFYLGDRDRMRGYNIATLTGDSGAMGSVELSRYFAVEGSLLQAIMPSVFFDAGIVQRNNDLPVMPSGNAASQRVGYSSKVLASTGVAARLFLAENFVLSGWVGLPLSEDGRDSYLSPAAYIRLTKTW